MDKRKGGGEEEGREFTPWVLPQWGRAVVLKSEKNKKRTGKIIGRGRRGKKKEERG